MSTLKIAGNRATSDETRVTIWITDVDQVNRIGIYTDDSWNAKEVIYPEGSTTSTAAIREGQSPREQYGADTGFTEEYHTPGSRTFNELGKTEFALLVVKARHSRDRFITADNVWLMNDNGATVDRIFPV